MSQIVDGYLRSSAGDIGPQMEFMLGEGIPVTLQISGDSMRPLLKPYRDAVVLEKFTDWPPKRGDILLFRSERSASGYAVHRAVAIKKDGPIMNGDCQNWVEGPVEKERVLAKATVLLRKDEPVDMDSFGYRLYVRLWPVTRVIRWPLFALWRGIKRLLGRK